MNYTTAVLEENTSLLQSISPSMPKLDLMLLAVQNDKKVSLRVLASLHGHGEEDDQPLLEAIVKKGNTLLLESVLDKNWIDIADMADELLYLCIEHDHWDMLVKLYECNEIQQEVTLDELIYSMVELGNLSFIQKAKEQWALNASVTYNALLLSIEQKKSAITDYLFSVFVYPESVMEKAKLLDSIVPKQ
jgi:hypothetical protein